VTKDTIEPDQGGAAQGADVSELAAALGHAFADPGLLADAVTHPSLMGLERSDKGTSPAHGPGIAYERLEFLGDRVLGLCIAEWLLERFPAEKEGALAKRHASLVRREALGAVAEGLDLGRYLRLSPAEDSGGGRGNRSILADACEAVIGALYLDGGLEAAKRFIRGAWDGMIDRHQPPPLDPKTALQEWAQGRGRPLPVYEMVGQSGPAHEPVFRVRVTVQGEEPATAEGSSKRAAEKQAASALLRQLGVAVHE